jgi:hypothetical protein
MLFIILPPGVIGESGPFFQGRFKSILIDADNYALVLSAYVHLNPLRAGIVRQIEDYPWSSYLDYLNLRKANISDPSFILKSIDDNTSNSIKRYREYVIEYQEMKDPLKKSYHHIALGSETFIEAVSQAAKKFEQKSEVNNKIKEYMQKVITALK